LEVHGSWVDPRDLDEEPPTPAPTSVPTTTTPTTTPTPSAPEPSTPTPRLKSAGLMNTPSTPKRMVGSPVTPTTVPKVTPDPWAPKKKSDGGTIVAPGARVRFGSGVSKG
jgi:hypothetical protein